MFALRSAPASRAAVRALHVSALRFAEKSALETSLRDGLKSAMKAKDKAAVSVLKATIAEVTNAAKVSANPLEPATQDMAVNALRKALNKRTAAAEEYAPGAPGANEEMFAGFQNEVKLLQTYLPEAPSGETVQAFIDEIVAALPERNNKATGQVMKALWERLGDARASVDKKDVAKRVSEALKA